MLIHLVAIVINSIDTSAANWDSVFKRTKGPLPTTAYTVWGQNNADTQQSMDPGRQGDGERIDGYLYLERPLTTEFKKGDKVVSIDGRAFDAEIVEVRDESAYQSGHTLVRLDYRRNWDASVGS